MAPNPFLGVLFHAIGGLAAGSFYIPFKRVRGWAWETYWLTGGLFIWMICPVIVAAVTVRDLSGVYQEATWPELAWPFLLGIGWGIGHLTFGLSLRYLGMSLGMGLSLGFCTFFGAVIPSLVAGQFGEYFVNLPGRISLGGLAICLAGIVLCSWAGASKERELPDEVKRSTIREFDFWRGVWLALFAGIMSACFAIGVSEAAPLKAFAAHQGTQAVYSNNASLLLILGGGGVSNIVWCTALLIRNRRAADFVDRRTPLLNNYLFCTLAGVIAYAEFFFFGMGESQMGKFSVFASWPIHMAFIIVFSNMWGLVFHEWRGTSARTRLLLVLGLLILVGSALVSACGSYLQQ